MTTNTDNQYFQKTLKSAGTFLSRWRSATAEMWELTSSHKFLRIMLRRDNALENLVIACLDPVLIKGPVRWTNCDLRVETTALTEDGETLFRVADDGAGFEVICRALEVKENVRCY